MGAINAGKPWEIVDRKTVWVGSAPGDKVQDNQVVEPMPVPGGGRELTLVGVDGGLGAGVAGQVFGGIFGVSTSATIVQSVVTNNVCLVVTGCFQAGIGAFGGISGVQTGTVSASPLESGNSESVGAFISSGAGPSTVGSVNIGTDGSAGATRTGAGPGVGFAVGLEFCQVSTKCTGSVNIR